MRRAAVKASLLISSIILGILLTYLGFKPSETTQQKIDVPTTSQESTKSGTLGTQTNSKTYQVIKVIDGDTISVKGGPSSGWENEVRVRLIGIDTPETVDPRRPVGCFGKEASNKAKELMEGKNVILERDVSETDKYNRLLRYVYLPIEDGKLLFVNDYLVREGFAKLLTYPPDVSFNEQLLQAEKEARINKKGLWNSCPL